MFYLGTMEVVFVSAYHHLPGGMMLITDIWNSSIPINIVSIFGPLVVGAAILAPGNPSTYLFSRLVYLHGNIKDSPSVHVILGYCEVGPSFIQL